MTRIRSRHSDYSNSDRYQHRRQFHSTGRFQTVHPLISQFSSVFSRLYWKRRFPYRWFRIITKKASPHSITERRVPGLIPVLGSQPAGDVSHKPGGRLPLLSARPAVTLATLKRPATSFAVGEQRHNGCGQIFTRAARITIDRAMFEQSYPDIIC